MPLAAMTKDELIEEVKALRARVAELGGEQRGRHASHWPKDIQQFYREAPVGLCLVDAELRFVHINEMLAAINGLPVAEHIGRSLREVIPEIAEQVEPVYRRVIETALPALGFRVSGKTRAESDGDRHYLVSYIPLLSQQQEVLGVSTVVQDITGQTLAEESSELANRELKDVLSSVELLNAIIEGTTDVIFVKNLEGQHLMVNSACAAVIGKSIHEIVGRDNTQLFPPDVARRIIEADRAVTSSGAPQTLEEEIAPAGSDTPRTYLSTKAPLKDDQGDVIGLVGIARDVTERKRAEEQVRQLTADIQHASRLSVMGEMAAGIAHEIHQPLAVIANFANGCRRRLQKEKFDRQAMVDSMEQIASAAMRAGQIIRRIRDFVAKEQFEPRELDVNEAVRDALELAKLAVRNEGVFVEEDLAENIPQVTADRIQVVQVVLNLVLNGIEAMTDVDRAGRRLTVRTLVDDNQLVRIEVADVGSGIPDGDREKIFEQFVTSKPHGLGIGLSISRTIVEAHGGRIWFDPESPSGSVFRFTLPAIGPL